MGGADKPGLAVGGTPMLVSVAQAAAAAGTKRLIIVGPLRPGAVQAGLAALAAGRPRWLVCVREEPPGGGPVAALRRGLAEVSAPWLALLAADLPFLTAAHLAALLAPDVSAPDVSAADVSAADRPAADGAAAAAVAGVVLADAAGRPQWLTSCWRASELRTALAAYNGDSLHALLAPLRPGLTRLGTASGAGPPWLDCDTPDELAAARRAWRVHAGDSGGTP
jgi:molybdopterin-guanine dinucleotide biosynthesis protein A